MWDVRRKSTEEVGPDRAGGAGYGMRHGLKGRAGNLRQRGQINDAVNHLHDRLAKAGAGAADNDLCATAGNAP